MHVFNFVLTLLLSVSINAMPRQAKVSGEAPTFCDALLSTGQLTRVSELRERLSDMSKFLKELETHHKKGKSEPFAFSTPETAPLLEATYGPIITFTTFSRELTPSEHFTVSSHILGLLSSLPRSAAIVASGGTMGERGNAKAIGGGVGIAQNASRQFDFKTLSITASKGFKYKAAFADFILFSLGDFGSESKLMYQLSKALIVVGGGGQAYNEALEYLVYNPDGLLIVIGDPNIGGSSKNLAADPRFLKLAENNKNIIIAPSGSEAGLVLADRLGIKARIEDVRPLTGRGLNLIQPSADFHSLVPDSKILGFSGWSNFGRSPDAASNSEIVIKINKAIEYIHSVVSQRGRPTIYATAGNDPKFKDQVPAFETLVHGLAASESVRYLALTAKKLKLDELNPRIDAISYISPDWQTRTHQFVGRVDAFITGGGNGAVLDQAIQAANLALPHIHILGANTLTDMRMEKVKNPNLRVLTPEQILSLSPEEIISILHF